MSKNVLITIIEAFNEGQISKKELTEGLIKHCPEFAEVFKSLEEPKQELFIQLFMVYIKNHDIFNAIEFAKKYVTPNTEFEQGLVNHSKVLSNNKIEHLLLSITSKDADEFKLFTGNYGNPFMIAMMIVTYLEQDEDVKAMFDKLYLG